MQKQTFISGSPIQHILGMAWTSMLALLAVLLVDVIDLFWLGLLGDVQIVAALGYAWPVMFLAVSITLGLSAAMTALVSRTEGAGDRDRARQYALHILLYGIGLSSLMTASLWFASPVIMTLIGATGPAQALAVKYLQVVLLGLPIMCVSMSSGALLRAVGAKKRAMAAKMAGALLNAVLDPIMIFGFDYGLEGAAWATFLSRIAILAVAFHGAFFVHRMIGGFDWRRFLGDFRQTLTVMLPVSFAKAGPPLGSAFVIATMAHFGDSAVAASTIIERIVPFAYVGLSALPQAIGPIIGQNFGAKLFDRVSEIWRKAILLVVLYAAIVALTLSLGQGVLIGMLRIDGETAALLSQFCTWVAPCYIFMGLQNVAHASLNVTGRAPLATAFDLGKELLGVIPLVYLGASLVGAPGVLMGQAAGMVIFGLIAGIVAYGRIGRIPGKPAGNSQPSLRQTILENMIGIVMGKKTLQ
ncbi:MATE family efflux transporter [Aestuariispira ectoiniformans]|uniref:MATE family efflux transporter n=1 Tax=Aestuariispira ectoiniformans TaxID=2775080 RepID=UPI00223C4522|nr:MATE family efflux transporter [Aestuariispira ectoiniformans]